MEMLQQLASASVIRHPLRCGFHQLSLIFLSPIRVNQGDVVIIILINPLLHFHVFFEVYQHVVENNCCVYQTINLLK